MKKEIVSITESSILIALAVILEILFGNVLQFLKMPQGGSLSIAMLPIMVIGLRRGLNYGLMSGVVFGIINFFLDGFLWHWGSFFFDYIFAGAALGITGLFHNKRNIYLIIIAILLGGLLKYLSHSIGGFLFFTDYAKEQGYTTILGFIIYSFSYNAVYMFPSIISCTVVGALSRPIIYYEINE